jgi:hypothetical protein
MMIHLPVADSPDVTCADALITRLSRAKRILVRPTSAVLRFDGATKDAASIARELDVEWLIDGTVRRARDRIRVLELPLLAVRRTKDGRDWAGFAGSWSARLTG